MKFKKGNKPRGRPKGSRNRIPAILSKWREVNLTASPLDYMLDVLRGAVPFNRDLMEAAKAAAPYIHPKLINQNIHATVKRDANDYTDAELAALTGADSAGGDTDPGVQAPSSHALN